MAHEKGEYLMPFLRFSSFEVVTDSSHGQLTVTWIAFNR